MKFYKDGARTNPVMVSVAGSLNDEQIKALATYFGSLPKPSPGPSTPSAGKKAKK
jgi:cytochrome c553